MSTVLESSEPIRSGVLCSVKIRENFHREINLQPELLDDFLLNRDREVIIGRESHKYLVEKYLDPGERFAFDLSEGFESYDPKPGDEGILSILQYILKKAHPGQPLKDVIHGADFVCFRGLLTKFAASPYEEGGIGWKYVVTKFNDVFFLKELDTETRMINRAIETPKEKMFTYWGHKFEHFVFAKKGEEPQPNEVVSTWEELGAFFISTFPSNGEKDPEIKVFYSAEMDGLDKDGKHVEVKTQFRDLFVGRFFPQKALKWWLQSTFVGIDDVVVGFRTNEGIIHKMKRVSLEHIRQRCKSWKKDVCLRAAQHIFNQIRQFYNQQVKPGQALIVERKPDFLTIEFQVVPDKSFEILTDEFKTHFTTVEEAKEEMNLRKKREGPQNTDEDASDAKKAFVFT